MADYRENEVISLVVYENGMWFQLASSTPVSRERYRQVREEREKK